MPKSEPADETVEERDPEVPPADPPAEPTDSGTNKKKITDSDPIPESKWLDAPPERPYAEAITPEHRQFLRESGIRL